MTCKQEVTLETRMYTPHRKKLKRSL